MKLVTTTWYTGEEFIETFPIVSITDIETLQRIVPSFKDVSYGGIVIQKSGDTDLSIFNHKDEFLSYISGKLTREDVEDLFTFIKEVDDGSE